jgi:hypothetical protein
MITASLQPQPYVLAIASVTPWSSRQDAILAPPLIGQSHDCHIGTERHGGPNIQFSKFSQKQHLRHKIVIGAPVA